MSTPNFPIRQFYDIPAQETTDAVNQLIVELNQLFVQGGIAPTPGTLVTQKQLRTWLALNGNPLYIYTVDQAVTADIATAVNIQWNHGNTMIQGDALYNFIQSTLGLTGPQMLSAFAAMGAYTP
jgi:hypothetical protein